MNLAPPHLLTAVISASLIMTILSKVKDKRILFLISKPLTTILIISLAFYFSNLNQTFDIFVITALILSLFGDIFLMFKGAMFLAGLINFLTAHLFYILAFSQAEITANIPIIFALVIAAFSFIFSVWQKLGKYLLPVLAYIIVITCMLYYAIGFYTISNNVQGVLVLIAAVLFVISDFLLAVNMFFKSFKWAQPLIYLTYFPAQTMFAWSLAL